MTRLFITLSLLILSTPLVASSKAEPHWKIQKQMVSARSAEDSHQIKTLIAMAEKNIELNIDTVANRYLLSQLHMFHEETFIQKELYSVKTTAKIRAHLVGPNL